MTTTQETHGKVATTVPRRWDEAFFTNCPMVSANNIDQELGWCREEFKKIGVEYAYFRSRTENDWYPHYVHNDLRGKKVGLTKSLNTIKNDWWRIQEHAGIELMLPKNDMTVDDVEIVGFPYPDDWYDKPEMLQVNMNNPSELWLRRDHKHDLAFRPLENALEQGRRGRELHPEQGLPAPAGGHRQVQGHRGSLALPRLDLQMANCPAVVTCTDVMADEHPELVVAYMKAMIKVGRWANDNKHAAAVILNRQTFYRDAEDTSEGIKDVDLVPNLSPRSLASIEIGKNFMLSHGYIQNDFDVHEWARRSSSSRRQRSSSGRSGSTSRRRSCPRRPRWRSRPTVWADPATDRGREDMSKTVME